VMYFYMCLEEQIGNAMSRGLSIHEYFVFLSWQLRVRSRIYLFGLHVRSTSQCV
jgi:hypothetical protein